MVGSDKEMCHFLQENRPHAILKANTMSICLQTSLGGTQRDTDHKEWLRPLPQAQGDGAVLSRALQKCACEWGHRGPERGFLESCCSPKQSGPVGRFAGPSKGLLWFPNLAVRLIVKPAKDNTGLIWGRDKKAVYLVWLKSRGTVQTTSFSYSILQKADGCF